jgi:hypothetical protein
MRARLLILLLLVSSLYAGELQDAARRGDAGKIRQLLANGTDVNSPGERGRTALHEAALSGRLDIVQLLLDKGADRKILDDDHRSPAFLAASLTNPVLQAQILTVLGEGKQETRAPKEGDLWTLHGAASRGPGLGHRHARQTWRRRECCRFKWQSAFEHRLFEKVTCPRCNRSSPAARTWTPGIPPAPLLCTRPP